MLRSDTGFDTDTGFRNFFGFSRKSIGESIGILKTEKLVMGDTDTGSDKKRPITNFSVFVQNRLGNRYNLKLAMGWSGTDKNNRLPVFGTFSVFHGNR